MSGETTTTLNGQTLSPQDMAHVRKLLSEDAAVLVECVRFNVRGADGSVSPRRRMVRQWPRISDGERALCEAYLGVYASADNTTPSATVSNPKAGRETYAGAWRMIRTDLSRIRTDPAQQGVYQTLLFPADRDGNSGEFCSEDSVLHHEDAQLFSEASALPAQHAQATAGTIIRLNFNVDPETGLYSGQVVTDTAKPSAIYGTWSRSADRWTLRIRGEHCAAPLFPRASQTATADILALAAGIGAPFPGPAPSLSNPVLVSNADMDQYGLFSVTAEVSFPIAQLLAVAHAHRRYIDIDVSFGNRASVPTLDEAKTAANPPSGGIAGFEVVASFSARQNEFGLLDGSMTWRLPLAEKFGWCRVSSDEENPAWRYWAWNQNGDWSPSGGETPAATGTLLVKSSPRDIGAFFTVSKQGLGEWSFPCGTTVTLPAGTGYALSYTAPDGYTAPAGIGFTISDGVDTVLAGNFAAIEGGIAAPVAALYVRPQDNVALLEDELEDCPVDTWYFLKGVYIDADGERSVREGEYFYDDLSEAGVIEVAWADFEGGTGYSTDPDFDPEEGTPTPFDPLGQPYHLAGDAHVRWLDDGDWVVVDLRQTAWLDAEHCKFHDVNAPTWLDDNDDGYLSCDGVLYHWDGETLAAVPWPAAPQGGSADPVPVTKANAGEAVVRRSGASADEDAEEGVLYVLVSGADAGKLRSLSPVTWLLEDCTAMVAAASEGSGFIEGGTASGSTIFGTDAQGAKCVSVPTPPLSSSDKYILTTQFQFDFNEFGLVDVTATVQAEANPYWGTDGKGIVYWSWHGENKVRVVRGTHSGGSSTPTGNEIVVNKYIEYNNGLTGIRAFKTLAGAQTMAKRVLAGKDGGESVDCRIGKHGHWWVLTAEWKSHWSQHYIHSHSLDTPAAFFPSTMPDFYPPVSSASNSSLTPTTDPHETT